MAIDPESIEFQLLFLIMLSIVILKASLSVFLGWKIHDKTKTEGKFEFDFLFAIFFLMITLLISRAVWVYWDFILTKLDPNTFWISPNVEIWKFCAFTQSIGFAVVLYIIDKRGLNFKGKGIVAYFVLGFAIFRLFIPVNSMEDFQILEDIGTIETFLVFLIPVVFAYIGIKGDDRVRKTAFTIVIGVIIYALATIIITEYVAAPLREIFGSHVVPYTLFAIFKFTGLILISYASTKFYSPKK